MYAIGQYVFCMQVVIVIFEDCKLYAIVTGDVHFRTNCRNA